MASRFLKPSEIAKMCGVTPAGVRKWIRSGRLKAYSTPGGQYRVEESELNRFLVENGMPAQAAARSNAGQTTILIVDDEPDIVEFIRETLTLERPDYRLLAAYDGYDACILAGSEKPDLVLLDLVLPGLDGFEVARHIQQNPLTGDAKILVITAFDPLLTEDRLEDLDLAGVLQKPFEPEQLIQEVKRLLSAKPAG